MKWKQSAKNCLSSVNADTVYRVLCYVALKQRANVASKQRASSGIRGVHSKMRLMVLLVVE